MPCGRSAGQSRPWQWLPGCLLVAFGTGETWAAGRCAIEMRVLRHAGLSRRAFSGSVVLGAALPWSALAVDDYPSRTIRLIVASAPGSSPDVIARLVAAEMSLRLRQQVQVDNRVGASSIIGTNMVAKAGPDGYTIGYVTPTLVLNRALQMPLPFDADRDLQAVIRFGHQPLVLVVSSASPHLTLAEFINAARGTANKLSYASTGLGSIFHLAAELFFQSTGTSAVHVPYTAGPQAINDMFGGRVDFMFNALNVIVPHIRSGRLRALGVTSMNRSAALPEVPTFSEAGVKDCEVLTWGGLVAPAEVSPEVIGVLNGAANAALQAPSVRQTLVDSGYEVVGGTPASFKAFIQGELDKWRHVVRRADIQVR
jgi:tripartite-type tricarboxylate transporter receptor subunit TctC